MYSSNARIKDIRWKQMQKRQVSLLENTTWNVCNFSILALLRINNWKKILWRYFCSHHTNFYFPVFGCLSHDIKSWPHIIAYYSHLLLNKKLLYKFIDLLKNKRPTCCHLLFYFTPYVLNMFQTSVYPSSGACDCAVELPHQSFCSVKTEDLALV